MHSLCTHHGKLTGAYIWLLAFGFWYPVAFFSRMGISGNGAAIHVRVGYRGKPSACLLSVRPSSAREIGVRGALARPGPVAFDKCAGLQLCLLGLYGLGRPLQCIWGCKGGGRYQDAIFSRFAPTPAPWVMPVNTRTHKSSAPPSWAPIAIGGEIHRQILIRGGPRDGEMPGYWSNPACLTATQRDLNYTCL